MGLVYESTAAAQIAWTDKHAPCSHGACLLSERSASYRHIGHPLTSGAGNVAARS